MKTIRTAQFISTAVLMTILNASASMTYDVSPKTAEGNHPNVVQKTLTDSNGGFAPNGSDWGTIADTNLAATIDALTKKPAFVPEPSTMIAGALLLLPLAVSIIRGVRRVRAV